MKKLLLLLLAVALFYAAFHWLLPRYYLTCPNAQPIDTRTADTGRPSTASFVMEDAKCYNVPGYFRSFFPVDLLFIVVYTWLFWSLRAFLSPLWLKRLLAASIIAGALLDLGEDFSFAGYLLWERMPLATATAVFTTAKTVVLLLNILWAIAVLLWYFIHKFIVQTAPRRSI